MLTAYYSALVGLSSIVWWRVVHIVLGNHMHDRSMFFPRRRQFVLAMCGRLSLMPRHLSPASDTQFVLSARRGDVQPSATPGIYVCSELVLHSSYTGTRDTCKHPGHIFCYQCCHWLNYRHFNVLFGKVFSWAFQGCSIRVFWCIIPALRLKMSVCCVFSFWVYSTVHYIYPVRTVYLVSHHLSM